MNQPQNRQDPRRAEKPAPSPGYKAPPAEHKKPVPDGFVDPAAGIVFPQPRRRRR